MKIRNGFVSNSSSSSFIIRMSDLSEYQLDSIKDHIESARKLVESGELKDFYFDESEEWTISIKDYTIAGYTYMDNFDMYSFLKAIKIPEHLVK